LLTRLRFDERVSMECLQQIEEAERFLSARGYTWVRVRCHGDLARIEVTPEERERLLQDASVVYEGIRLTPEEIVSAAIEEQVHVVGLSILSGSHVPLVREVMSRMREAGLDKVPVVVGGIIPDEDARVLKQMGVARVYTPKDFRMTGMMGEIISLVERRMDDAAA
jgi:methylmalonyl-CoA mutase cobalamin-binding domain/chain